MFWCHKKPNGMNMSNSIKKKKKKKKKKKQNEINKK